MELSLPNELRELEQALAGRPLPGPSELLREVVLDNARRGLRTEQRRGRWRFAAATAAVALVWLNLSLAATQSTDFRLRVQHSGEPIESAARRIRQLVPELSAAESRRQALLLRAGSSLVPCPDLSHTAAPQRKE